MYLSVHVGPSSIKAVVAGDSHSCLIVDGEITPGAYCWGSNSNGQLGNDTTTDTTEVVTVQGTNSGATGIAAGGAHTCAVVNGGAQCWGSNDYGQLGNNSTTDSHIPVQVVGLTSGVTAVAAGHSHSCAVVNGGARCWGSNVYGQLGNGSWTNSLVPVQVGFP
jgi:alpha-tubulin suppressor-like RCC1 family protein